MVEDMYKIEPRYHKKRSKKKVIIIILGILALLIIGIIIFINSYINRSLPQLEGTIDLPILNEEVTVITDDSGVPHIQAENDHDLYIAQGYVQAQNRMFQMDLSRRQASGELSEVVGEQAIDQDKYFRTLGLRRAAEDSYELYSDEAKDILDYFSEGINAYINEATENGSLPVEFTLLGSEPEEWTPLDSLTIGKYMAFDLGGHWERQAFNYYLLNNFTEEKALELFPEYPQEKPNIIKDDEIDMASSFENAVIPHEFNGSNDWVVSGDKTESGKPLLADDPHLGLATPSVWLQMVLETDDLNVSGVIFAGVPGIILGHNDDVAWGVTNVGPDVQQLYMEKRNPDDKYEFLFEDEWEKAEVIDEPIKVKNEDTLDYQVVETRHGPVISEFAEDSGLDDVLSLRWTALDATTELEAIIDLNRALNWKEFEAGLEKFLAPAQNFVFAGKDGTIAYKANGNIPIYESGDDALLPLEGWEKENEWEEFIPFDELPTVVNPDKGYIATANNKIVGDDYPYHISNVWAQPYRFERISEVLEANDGLTLEDMKDLQMDTSNLQAREFVPIFVDVLSDVDLTANEQQAIDKLKDWDFKDEKESVEPLVFHHMMDAIDSEIYQEDIPANMMDLFTAKGQTTDQLIRKAYNGDESIWMEEAGGIEKVLHQALSDSLTTLTDDHGKDMDKWAWGDYHKVQFHHPLSSVNPILAAILDDKPISVDGSAVTPFAAAYSSDTGEVNHGASWRFVIDTEDMKSGYHIVGPGQFGHFKNEWYHDQMDDWVEGDFHKTEFSETDGLKLMLEP